MEPTLFGRRHRATVTPGQADAYAGRADLVALAEPDGGPVRYYAIAPDELPEFRRWAETTWNPHDTERPLAVVGDPPRLRLVRCPILPGTGHWYLVRSRRDPGAVPWAVRATCREEALTAALIEVWEDDPDASGEAWAAVELTRLG